MKMPAFQHSLEAIFAQFDLIELHKAMHIGWTGFTNMNESAHHFTLYF
jgi:hypothetical protein